MDPDADQDPAVFIIDLQDANKKQIFFYKVVLCAANFLALLNLLKGKV